MTAPLAPVTVTREEDPFPSVLTLDTLYGITQPWTVTMVRAQYNLPCDHCNGFVYQGERVYSDPALDFPVHPQCWMDAIADRDVRILSVSYNPLRGLC
jgi:hypothetical protein